ncbi:MAG: phosphoadenylyl-sulfate reductase [Phycisphaerales bacterium]
MKLPVIDHTHRGDSAPTPLGPDTHPSEVIAWALDRFAAWSVAATTGFGMEGCALIDMLAQQGRRIRVIYIDTHFFFKETLELRDRLIERYPELTFINAGTMLTPERQHREHGPDLWKRDPDACCNLRKVQPLRRALRGVDAWFAAIRRDQSATRATTELVQWDWQYQLVKISPLAFWSRQRVWDYIRKNDIPYNPLHDQGYPSIGCTHCTARVPGLKPGDYSRAGRWPGTEKTECGIHRDPHPANPDPSTTPSTTGGTSP